MGSETTYLGVVGRLIRLISALNANATALAQLDGARLRLAKLVVDVEGIAGRRVPSGMTKFLHEHYGTRSEALGELALPPFRGHKPRTSKSPPPSEPATPAPAPTTVTTARSAADSNFKQ